MALFIDSVQLLQEDKAVESVEDKLMIKKTPLTSLLHWSSRKTSDSF